MVLKAILEEMERAEGHVPNFKGSPVGLQVLNRRRTRGMLLSMRTTLPPMRCSNPIFWRGFCMQRPLFLGIMQVVRSYYDYFKLKKDDIGHIEFSGIQKCTTAMRMLEYGKPLICGTSTS